MNALSADRREMRGEVELIRPPRAFVILALIAAVAFVSIGGWILAVHPEDVRSWLIGPLCIAFFGWAAVTGARRLLSGWAMRIGPDGFTIAGPSFKPKLVFWRDVDEIGVAKIGRSRCTGVRLKSYQSLVAQYSSEEARNLIQRNKVLSWFAGAAFIVRPTSIGVSSEEVKAVEIAVGTAKDVGAVFANSRAAYGYDILLGWMDRDRDAEEFAQFLEQRLRTYIGSVG